MNVLVQIHDGIIVLVPLKKGKMQTVVPLTPFEARIIANELLDKADEAEGITTRRLDC